MVLVRGNEPYTGCEIAHQGGGWKVAATTGFLTVPLQGETFSLEQEQLGVPREMSTQGYREIVEYGRRFVRGSLTVLGRYDARWFHLLLAHTFGQELAVVTDTWQDGTVLNGGGGSFPPSNTHIYQYSSTLPDGLTIRMHKGGPSLGKYDQFVGCMVDQITIEQSENEPVKFTFGFVGYTVTSENQVGVLNPIGGIAPMRIRDYTNQYGYVKTGATLTALGTRSFRITANRQLRFGNAYITNLDDIQKPGVTEIRDVKGSIVNYLEQDYNDNHRPWKEYLAKVTTSKCDILLVADVADVSKRLYAAGGGTFRPFGMRLEFPKIAWERVTNPVSSGGENDQTQEFVAQGGTFDATGTLPDAQVGDFRIVASVKDADEPSPDAKFSPL